MLIIHSKTFINESKQCKRRLDISALIRTLLYVCDIYFLFPAPEPVSDITAVQNASRHIKLRWTQPCHPNGLIINYTIEVKNKNDSSNSVNDTRFTNNSITSYNVTHLLPYRSYLFIVRTQVEGVAQLSAPQESIFQTSTEGNHFDKIYDFFFLLPVILILL